MTFDKAVAHQRLQYYLPELSWDDNTVTQMDEQ